MNLNELKNGKELSQQTQRHQQYQDIEKRPAANPAMAFHRGISFFVIESERHAWTFHVNEMQQ